MASEHAHKIDGAVRKLRAVMEAFDMKGTNRATMLNAINTINALRTRPAPAAADTGLVRYDLSIFGNGIVEMGGGAYVRFDQAEELLAAERARCAVIAREFSTSAHVAHSIEAGCFPEKSDIRDAIADAIMGNDNAQK